VRRQHEQRQAALLTGLFEPAATRCAIDLHDLHGIVQKLWNYCNVLRDDGLS